MATAAVLASSFTTMVSAESFTTQANIGQDFPATFQSGTKYLATIDAGYDFNSIDKVCISAEVNSGTASHATIEVSRESNDDSISNISIAHIPLQEIIPATEENPFIEIKQLNLNFCDSSILASNLLDGVSEFNLTISGAGLEFNDLQVSIEGAVGAEHIDSELYTASFGHNLSYPLTLDNGQSLKSETDIGYQFESIESVCIKGEVQSGTADAFSVHYSSEASNDFIGSIEKVMFMLIDGNEFESCGAKELLNNFLDGSSVMTIAPAGGYVTLWDLKIEIKGILTKSIDEMELSVRSHNCLQAAGIRTISELVDKEESEMLKFKNFGRKSLTELQEKLGELELHFGMDVKQYLETE